MSNRFHYPLLKNLKTALAIGVLALFCFGFLGWGPAARELGKGLASLQLGPIFLRLWMGLGKGLVEATDSLLALRIFPLIAAICILGLTILGGRWYCALLCPLGTAQDLVSQSRVSRKKLKGRLFPLEPHRESLVQYGLLGLFLGSLFLGSLVLFQMIDPYALSGRLLRDLLLPVLYFLNYIVFYVGRTLGHYLPLLSYEPELLVFFFTLLTAGSLFLLTHFMGRVYCGTLCPVGTLLGFCSKKSYFHIQLNQDACISCLSCAQVCPTGAIQISEPGVPGRGKGVCLYPSRCVLCFRCTAACPTQALQYGSSRTLKLRNSLEQSPGKNVKETRRQFFHSLGKFLLLGGVSWVAAYLAWPTRFLMHKRRLTPSGEPNIPSTPPGSISLERFSSLCVSCHLCVSHCPTGVLTPSFLEYGLHGIFQPVMNYSSGYCEYTCTRCGEVCPTKAILPVTLAEKKTVQIGRVHFAEERCVVVTKGTICGACAEVCPTHAVGMVPYRAGLEIPATDNILCVGCGSCEHACPVPQKAIYVKGLEIHGRAEVRKPVYSTPKEPAKKEFPF